MKLILWTPQMSLDANNMYVNVTIMKQLFV